MFTVTVPVYPISIRNEFTVDGQPESHVALPVSVLSKTMSSSVVGSVSVSQFATVEQLLSAPPPSQITVAAVALSGIRSKSEAINSSTPPPHRNFSECCLHDCWKVYHKPPPCNIEMASTTHYPRHPTPSPISKAEQQKLSQVS